MSATKDKKPQVNYNELVSELKNTLNFHLKDLFTSFFNNADDALFDLANEASNNEEQKTYFDLLHSIRTDKANLSRGLSDALRSYLKPISAISPADQEDDDDDDEDEELSLVSQETMDELVLINTIAAKTYDRFSDDIGKLEVRLDFLAEHTPMIFSKDALTPLHFCESFQQSISILDITTAEKLILYKLFDNEVASQLNLLYDTINSLLIEAGILPKIKLHAQKSAKKNSGGPADETPEYMIEEDEHEEDFGHSGGGSGGGGSRQASGQPAGSGQNQASPNQGQGQGQPQGQAQSGQQQNTGQGQGQQADNNGQPNNGNNGENNNASNKPLSKNEEYTNALVEKYGNKNIGGYHIGKASEIIRDFIGSDAADAGSMEGNPQYYGHKDVLSALTQMQSVTHTQIQAAPPVIERIDAAAIKQALLSTIASQTGGTITKQINQVIEKTIDFIKLIFDAIIDDPSISDTIKALLLTLQIPVIKASMLDQEFFVNDDHPARELLDKVAELGIGISDHTDPLYVELDRIIKTLLAEYSSDINAFVSALEDVKSIISKREEESEEKERLAQEQIQKEHARKIVLWELRKSTLEKKLPSLVHKLVLKIWPTLMFNHYIKSGKQNDEWIFMVTTLTELIDSVQPPTNLKEHKALEESHIGMLERVEKRISHSKRAKTHLTEVMQDLRDTYKHLLETKDFEEEKEELSTMPVMDTPVEETDDSEASAQSEFEDQTLEEVQEPHPDEPVDLREKLQLLPNDVRPGVWFQVTMDSGKVRRLKLSVIIMEEALLVFVDHNGERVIERDAETFAEELKTGAAQIIMHHSVFDHALGNVFSTMQ